MILYDLMLLVMPTATADKIVGAVGAVGALGASMVLVYSFIK